MQLLKVEGVKLLGVETELGEIEIDNFDTCVELFGEKADAIIKTTGIKKRRVAAEGTTSLDLCVRAAKRLMLQCKVTPEEIGAVVSVSFTPAMQMPGNAQLAQAALGFNKDVIAIDLNHACAGYPYGLYIAAKLVQDTGKKVLLLDGDVQTPHVDPTTAPLLSDAGTATLVGPVREADIPVRATTPWSFAFLTDGAKANLLNLQNDKFHMDGFGVFKFVAQDAAEWLQEFIKLTTNDQPLITSFIPHQANVYMVRELAKKLGLSDELVATGDEVGNCASASVPIGLKKVIRGQECPRPCLLAGFGGGLSAGAALIHA